MQIEDTTLQPWWSLDEDLFSLNQFSLYICYNKNSLKVLAGEKPGAGPGS